jgi:tetrahydromethanopterin S-methyltransferase subunit B
VTFNQVLKEVPELTDFGIGLYRNERNPEKFAKERQDLIDNIDRVMETRNWLIRNIQPIKTPTLNSYSGKHIAEQHIGYITNGVFIAAAMMAEFPYKMGTPNVTFGMSRKSLKEVRGIR